jgi:putative transposase
MRRAFKYRLYLNKRQARLLSQQLEECRWLYNHLLAERKDAWENRRESLRLYDQQATLPALKAERPLLARVNAQVFVNAQVLQNVAVRIDLAFQAFFRRCKAGETPGYPRFRGVGRYDSITYPQAPSGCKLDTEAHRVRLHGVGILTLCPEKSRRFLVPPIGATPRFATTCRSPTLPKRSAQWLVSACPAVPHTGWLIEQVLVHHEGHSSPDRSRGLSGLFSVKVVLHRPLEGIPKTANVTRSSTGKWYICFSCECPEPSPLPKTGQQVGIDVGLRTFAALSTAQAIANPRFFRQEEHALAKGQRGLSQEEKGTPERARRRKIVARVHERIGWRRGDIAHQQSRRIVNQFDLIAVEDLSVNRMAHNHCLAKSIHDTAWSQFTFLLSSKAAWASRKYAAVNPAYMSQDCSGCGHRQALSLADSTYTCPCCGIVLDRDLNASLNILSVGQHALASA